MARRTNVFYAYPYTPPSVGDVVQLAIDELKSSSEITNNNIRFRPWTHIRASGKHLAQTVMGNIDRFQIFACDLTYPNSNVSFELGYAIGRSKRIFPSLDTSIEEAPRRLRLLSVGWGLRFHECCQTFICWAAGRSRSEHLENRTPNHWFAKIVHESRRHRYYLSSP